MTNPLTANTNEQIFLEPGREYRLDISDDLGGGSFSLEYVDSGGSRRTIEGTNLAVNTGVIFTAPRADTYVVLTGATSPNLCYNLTKVNFE